MGLNRMMMKSNEILKDIEAEMIPSYSGDWLGFVDLDSVGQLSPNPLPNGVHVSSVALSSVDGTIQLLPATIKSCTFEELGVTVTHGEVPLDFLGNYLSGNYDRPVPITFHFN